jgi:hypothetical protein
MSRTTLFINVSAIRESWRATRVLKDDRWGLAEVGDEFLRSDTLIYDRQLSNFGTLRLSDLASSYELVIDAGRRIELASADRQKDVSLRQLPRGAEKAKPQINVKEPRRGQPNRSPSVRLAHDTQQRGRDQQDH